MSSGGSIIRCILFCVCLVSLTACIPAMNMPNNYEERETRAKKLKTILLLTPDIVINSLSAGDVKEEMPEWSKKGRNFVIKAVQVEMKDHKRKLKVLDPNTKFKKTVSDVKDLHLAVMESIYDHALFEPGNMNVFPQRIENFDYTVGSVKDLLKAYKADGMLIIRGEDNISTGGRKTLGVVKYINPFSQKQTGGMTFLEATLTDANGDVLWFLLKWNAGDYDMRDPKEASKFVNDMFEDFPGGKS